jgi:hypothetical protein
LVPALSLAWGGRDGKGFCLEEEEGRHMIPEPHAAK